LEPDQLLSDFVAADGSFAAGRRLRTKLIGLTGTMSAAPSQDSALDLLFFAVVAGGDWQIAAEQSANSNITATMYRKHFGKFSIDMDSPARF
jgi:hypothetical protein